MAPVFKKMNSNGIVRAEINNLFLLKGNIVVLSQKSLCLNNVFCICNNNHIQKDVAKEKMVDDWQAGLVSIPSDTVFISP